MPADRVRQTVVLFQQRELPALLIAEYFRAADHLLDFAGSMHRDQFDLGMLVGEHPKDFIGEGLADIGHLGKIEEEETPQCGAFFVWRRGERSARDLDRSAPRSQMSTERPRRDRNRNRLTTQSRRAAARPEMGLLAVRTGSCFAGVC